MTTEHLQHIPEHDSIAQAIAAVKCGAPAARYGTIVVAKCRRQLEREREHAAVMKEMMEYPILDDLPPLQRGANPWLD